MKLPIVLPIVLPIGVPSPGPGRLGWLAWFKMLLGLGGAYFVISSFIDIFSIIVFVPKQLHINDGELLSSVLSVEFQRASFKCFRKPFIS